MISQTPGVACQTWASCVVVLVWMFFFWPLVDCVVLFVFFFLWGKHVALFDPIDPGSRCPTLCNQALVHCDGPMPHTDLEDEKYDEFKGHWTDLFFYIILWWCSQGLTQGFFMALPFWQLLFQVGSLTTLKPGPHSARSLHDFAWSFSDGIFRSFCSIVPSTRAAFVISVERWWRCLPCRTHHSSLCSQSHGRAVPDNGRVHREEPCFFS